MSCSRGPAPSDESETVAVARSGEAIYRKHCRNCHQGSVPNSPVLGKIEDWEDRIEKGRTALIENVRTGMPPGMPKMGTCTTCTDEELANVVDYILEALEEDVAESEQILHD